MQNLSIAVCGFSSKETGLLLRFIESSSDVPGNTAVFQDIEEFLSSFEAGSYQLIIMDLCLGNSESTSGLPEALLAMRRVRLADPYVYTVFISTETGYAIDAYRLRVRRFLEKPICETDVVSVLKDAADYASLPHREMLSQQKRAPGGPGGDYVY